MHSLIGQEGRLSTKLEKVVSYYPTEKYKWFEIWYDPDSTEVLRDGTNVKVPWKASTAGVRISCTTYSNLIQGIDKYIKEQEAA